MGIWSLENCEFSIRHQGLHFHRFLDVACNFKIWWKREDFLLPNSQKMPTKMNQHRVSDMHFDWICELNLVLSSKSKQNWYMNHLLRGGIHRVYVFHAFSDIVFYTPEN